ncbi:MAG: TrkA family potassium uptake protein [Actinomycetota bacterium]
MHVIVVGCGRVGSTVAVEMAANGHDVVVIDRRREAFRRLGAEFEGTTITGIGFDRGVLERAGITPQSAVMAVTSGDNSNILIARVARETFGVDHVVARIYDPRRAAIYEGLGIATVASVAWTAGRVLQLVLRNAEATEWVDPTARFAMIERRVPAGAAGMSVSQVEQSGVRIVLLSRDGTARLTDGALLLQQDDMVHGLVPCGSLDQLDQAFADYEGGHR